MNTSPMTSSPTPPADPTHGSPKRALAVWLFLIAATLLAWLLGERGAHGPWVVAVLFGAAFVKGNLILLEYMALRHAPIFWRALTIGWLSAVCGAIALAYWKGMAT